MAGTYYGKAIFSYIFQEENGGWDDGIYKYIVFYPSYSIFIILDIFEN